MIDIVTEESLKKKLLWDLLPHDRVQELAAAAGVIPGSDEGEEMEHRASHFRMAAAEPIEQVCVLLASLSGEIMGRCMLENQGIEPSEETLGMYAHLAITTAHAVLVNLMDLELVHLGGHP